MLLLTKKIICLHFENKLEEIEIASFPNTVRMKQAFTCSYGCLIV